MKERINGLMNQQIWNKSIIERMNN